jgi:hypothetical protein
MPSGHGIKFEGLKPPTLQATGSLVSGKDIEKLRLQNKRTRHALQEQQQMNMVQAPDTYTPSRKVARRHVPIGYCNIAPSR